MGSKKARILAMLSGFFIVVLIMFRDSSQTGKMLFGNDTITIYMAFAEFAKKMMTVYHTLPAWLPDIYLGMPMIGSSSLLFFYPTDFLFMLLSMPLQYMYAPDLVIHMFLAALGMYLFLKKLKLEQPAALFGASAIMISGYIISYVYAGHWNNIKAGALIPLAFFFAHSALEDKKLLHYLNTALVLALMMLATGMQIMAYTFLAVIFYSAFYIIYVEKEKKQKLLSAAYMAVCAVFILLFSAPQFIPSMQYTNLSWRGDVSYEHFISWSFHPVELITFLIPQFFGLFSSTYWGYMSFTLTTYYFGIIPFMLLFFLAAQGRHKKQVIFFSAASVVFMFFAFGGYTFIYKIFYYIPVFKQFRNPSRFLYLVTFFVITLASIGLNNLTEEKDEKKSFKIWQRLAAGSAAFLILFTLSLTSGGLDSLLAYLHKGIRNAEIPASVMSGTKEMIKQDLAGFFLVSLSALVIIFLLIKKKVKFAFLACFMLAAVNFADVYRIDSKFITFEDYNRLLPGKTAVTDMLLSDREPYRTANLDQLYGANRNIYYGIQNLGGIHGLMPATYKQLENSGSFRNININRQFNIRYYISSEDIKVPGFNKVLDSGTIKLFKDTFARNRVFFTDKITRLKSPQEILEYLNSAAFTGYEAVTGQDVPDKLIPAGKMPGNGDAVIREYRPGQVKASVNSAYGGMAVFSEGYYPQWKAKIDNNSVKIYSVNFYSLGIMVPAGAHEIEFYYDKTGIYIGLLIALAAFIFYGFVLLNNKKEGK